MALHHTLGSPVASSNFNEKTVLICNAEFSLSVFKIHLRGIYFIYMCCSSFPGGQVPEVLPCWLWAGGLHRHTLATALLSSSASLNLSWAAACSDYLTKQEKQCGNTEISAGSSSLWNKVSLTISCSVYLFHLLLAGIPQAKIDSWLKNMCHMSHAGYRGR